VVVDDGSSDETPQVAEQEFPFSLQYVRQSNQGAAAARNVGAEKGTGDILIFVDDDMTLGEHYVAGLVETHARYDNVVGMGTCYSDAAQRNSVFSRVYAQRAALRASEHEGQFVSFADCVTNNLSVERGAFFEIGMMEDIGGDGPTWWGDVDFGYRAYLEGYRFRQSAQAVCYHRDYSIGSLETACQHAEEVYRIAPLLLRKYPDLRRHLHVFRDKTPVSIQDDSPMLIINKLFHQVTAWAPLSAGMFALVRLLEQTAPNPALLGLLYRWIVSAHIYRGYRAGLREHGPVSLITTDGEDD
jgi:glycosyltransferase involved in cell wall biosynthesis